MEFSSLGTDFIVACSPESGSEPNDDATDNFRNVLTETDASMLGTPTSIDNDYPEEDYEKQADEIIEETWKMFKDADGWSSELKSSDGKHVVVSKNFAKWNKVFKLTSTINGTREQLVELLFDKQDEMAKWSPTVNDSRILEVVNRDLYISYQLTNEQAQGIVAKRDFVNLTVRRFIDDVAVLGAQACLHRNMPPKDNCVRGENGPTAYIVEKIDDTTSKFTWILNVDLKGWLPQYLINSALANVQIGLVEALRKHMSKTNGLSSSVSSSISSSGDPI